VVVWFQILVEVFSSYRLYSSLVYVNMMWYSRSTKEFVEPGTKRFRHKLRRVSRLKSFWNLAYGVLVNCFFIRSKTPHDTPGIMLI
jgi:hypothetical protein